MRLIQVAVSGTKAQVTTQNIYASVVVAYATAASSFLGDDTVTTGTGIGLPTTTSLVIPVDTPRGVLLSSLWVIGSSGNVNILYEPSA